MKKIICLFLFILGACYHHPKPMTRVGLVPDPDGFQEGVKIASSAHFIKENQVNQNIALIETGYSNLSPVEPIILQYPGQVSRVPVRGADIVLLQHPTNRNLVQCDAEDNVCLMAYNRLGYVPNKDLSAHANERMAIEENNTLNYLKW